MRRREVLAAAVWLMAVIGCDDTGSTPHGALDATADGGSRLDMQGADVGPPDGEVDAVPSDARAPDAAPGDAIPVDATADDATADDDAEMDAIATDAMVDATAPDAMVDAMSVDADPDALPRDAAPDGPPPCVPTGELDTPDPAGEDTDCDGLDGDLSRAVFVAIGGDDLGEGTIDGPVASVQRAVDVAAQSGASQILLAAGDFDLDETLVLPDGVGLHGGYEPEAGWRRGDAFTVLNGPAVAIVARALPAGATLSRLTVRAADAEEPGGASIALLAVGSGGVTLYDGVSLEAGRGADGLDGASGADGRAGRAGADGEPGAPDNEERPGAGGAGATRPACAAAGGDGGEGGAGARVMGDFDGQAGADGVGGTPGGAGGRNNADSRDGEDGATGARGARGEDGAPGDAVGRLTPDPLTGLRYGAAAGGAGLPGAPGGGGGGGGGGAGQGGPLVVNGAGNGGGGGGAGGCPGAGGGGGGGGGASIALVVVDTPLVLDDVFLVTAGGGAGGGGGDGGAGGPGGAGGAGADEAPGEIGIGGAGGPGGRGGRGGHGAGGGGGPSVGLWMVGGPAPRADVVFELGPAGVGGPSSGESGADGLRAEVHAPGG